MYVSPIVCASFVGRFLGKITTLPGQNLFPNPHKEDSSVVKIFLPCSDIFSSRWLEQSLTIMEITLPSEQR